MQTCDYFFVINADAHFENVPPTLRQSAQLGRGEDVKWLHACAPHLQYGLDYGKRQFEMQIGESESHYTVIKTLGDVSKIPTAYTEEHFSSAFYSSFENSDVSIHELVSVVFLGRRLIQNYDRDRTVGRRLVTLY